MVPKSALKPAHASLPTDRAETTRRQILDVAARGFEAMLDVGCDIYERDVSARAVSRLCHEWSTQEDLVEHSRSHLSTWFDITTELLVRAQEEGDVRLDIDPRRTAETICSAFIGIE